MMGTILTLAAAAFVTMFTLSLCRITGHADCEQERNWREYEAKQKNRNEGG